MPTAEAFVVDDHWELLALHRALFEAQFTQTPEDKDVPGSPLVASIANRVVDLLAKKDERWSDWRQAEKHPDRVSIARRRLWSRPDWSALAAGDREALVRNNLAPLVPSDELVQRLVEGSG